MITLCAVGATLSEQPKRHTICRLRHNNNYIHTYTYNLLCCISCRTFLSTSTNHFAILIYIMVFLVLFPSIYYISLVHIIFVLGSQFSPLFSRLLKLKLQYFKIFVIIKKNSTKYENKTSRKANPVRNRDMRALCASQLVHVVHTYIHTTEYISWINTVVAS